MIRYLVERLPIWIAIVLFVCAVAMSCSALRKAGWTAGGASGGALVGSTMGPGGAAVGAGVGAIAASTISENDELRDGTLTGDGALDYWRGKATTETARASHLWTWIVWLGVAVGAYFAWRNREHLIAFVKTRDWARLSHAVLGTKLPLPPKESPESGHGDRHRG